MAVTQIQDNKSAKILIVEDNKELRRLYQAAFQRSGFEVEVCEESAEGIKKAESFRPDVVLLDLLMPHVDGFDVLKAMSTDAISARIVVLSNLGDVETIKRALDSGAEKFYCKIDYPPKKMVREIQQLLQKQRAEQEPEERIMRSV